MPRWRAFPRRHSRLRHQCHPAARTSTLRGDHRNAAEALAAQVAASTTAINKLVPQGAPTETTARARAFINDLGLRAHRRPLTTAESDRYYALFQKGPQLFPELGAFAGGVRLVVENRPAVPLLPVPDGAGQATSNGRIPLSGYEVAAKLALAITGSGPDKLLLDAAAAGALDPGKATTAVAEHAERLLKTPRAKATALHLHTQTYALSRYSIIQRNPANYPQFGAGTVASMKKSAELFFQSIFDEDLGVRAILTSPNAYVDANLAPFTACPQVLAASFRESTFRRRARWLLNAAGLSCPVRRGVPT